MHGCSSKIVRMYCMPKKNAKIVYFQFSFVVLNSLLLYTEINSAINYTVQEFCMFTKCKTNSLFPVVYVVNLISLLNFQQTKSPKT